MTGSHDMLETARRGATCLGAGRPRVVAFLEGRLQPDGGFRGRGPARDLYYTAFAIDSLQALDAPDALRPTAGFLDAFGTGDTLDFMHLVSLARCRARLPYPAPVDAAASMGLDEDLLVTDGSPGGSPSQATPPCPTNMGGRGSRRAVAGSPVGAKANETLLARLAPYAAPDGGYNTVAGAPFSSVTALFLAWLAYQDLGVRFPDPTGVVLALSGLRSADGAYGNLPQMAAGTTLATAGALLLEEWLGQPVGLDTAQWLLDRYVEEGGFLASPGAPRPDLLSTATAVYALHTLHLDLSQITPSCRAFVAALQRPDGGYGGHRMDDIADSEYTFYALLTLGCLDSSEP
jgi:hypothetical protein